MKFKIKPVFNKANGQINISLPKKKLSKDFLKHLDKIHEIEIKFDRS
jgi:hypothetical protein